MENTESKPESGEPNVTHGVVTIRNKVTTKQAVQLTWANWNAICDFVPKPWFIKGVYLDRYGQPLPDDRWRFGENNDDLGLLLNTQNSTAPFLVRGNDWIVKGQNAEFYPVKPDIFEKSYEILAGVSAQGSEPTKRVFYCTTCGAPKDGHTHDRIPGPRPLPRFTRCCGAPARRDMTSHKPECPTRIKLPTTGIVCPCISCEQHRQYIAQGFGISANGILSPPKEAWWEAETGVHDEELK